MKPHARPTQARQPRHPNLPGLSAQIPPYPRTLFARWSMAQGTHDFVDDPRNASILIYNNGG
jgi:hypothetical protein